jgi:hypothetical protein
MKGKRKVKNTKWALVQNIQNEARSTLAKRSAKAGRFLDAVSTTATVNESNGLLAGSVLNKNERVDY